MYICVDFDGTVVEHRYPYIGKPVPHAIKWLKKWEQVGAKLILFTMRSDGQKEGDLLREAVEYLESNGVKLYAVNHNPKQAKWSSSPKAYAHMYVDDAAFGCPLTLPKGFKRPCVDWSTVGPEVYKILSKRFFSKLKGNVGI